ncbi:MAG: sugar phosphorylase [Verrucomicrobiia bacterium]
MQSIIKDNLRFVYGKADADVIYSRLQKIIEKYRSLIEKNRAKKAAENADLTEKTAFLITYPDQIQSPHTRPLRVLRDVANEYLKGIINTIHILPFYPYSSDDGFSVIDYYSVNSELGDWNDIERLGADFDLMFDAVVNHVSSRSLWFEEYLKGNPEYQGFFIEIEDEGYDFSKVFRPRTSPLLTEFETRRGRRKIWTTFSADQIDLNYRNPEVLLKIIDLLLFYVSKGALFIRLDAIAFLWKQSGTTCVSLEQTQKIVQIFRAVLDSVAPDVKIITETNLPHRENVSYFGPDGVREADLVYNFALPPLVLFSLLSKDATKLTRWLASCYMPQQNNKEFCFLNFLASHDGIGVTPVTGILDESEKERLAQNALKRGGFVSYKSLPDGSKAPYELNINYLDALIDDPEDSTALQLGVKRFIVAHAIMLAIAGVPAVYFHSLFGSRGDREAAIKTGILRRINRKKLDLDVFTSQMNESNSIRRMVYDGLRQLLKLRCQLGAFNPYGTQKALEVGSENFAVLRQSPSADSALVAVQNVSGRENKFEINLPPEYCNTKWRSVFSLKEYVVESDLKLKLEIGAYGIDWIQKILG